jgi:thiamine-monophosphate kinase
MLTVMQTSRLPGEFALIARYFAPLARGFPGAYGLLDDAAVIAPAAGCELVAKTDAIIGGVHFLPDDPADLIARKALRVNLSDLAAKGAQPRAYMLDLALPNTIEEDWVAAFARGLAIDQAEYSVHLIGGDTNSTPGPVTIAIMAFGDIAAGRIIRRGGAHPGEGIFVTGTIGDAALGLRVLRGEIPCIDAAAAQFLVGRYRLPQPRVTLGPRLVGLATAALDISDGLVADLRHICEVSNLVAIIETQRVPLSPAARVAIATENNGLALALTGGDDYEILFTAPPSVADELAEVSQAFGIPITAIGHMEAPSAGTKTGVRVMDAAGRPFALEREGWVHF